MNDEIKDALDERLDWIREVTKRGLEHGPLAIRDAIDDLDEEQVRSVLFVLMLHYRNEAEQMQDAIARQQLSQLDGEVLH